MVVAGRLEQSGRMLETEGLVGDAGVGGLLEKVFDGLNSCSKSHVQRIGLFYDCCTSPEARAAAIVIYGGSARNHEHVTVFESGRHQHPIGDISAGLDLVDVEQALHSLTEAGKHAVAIHRESAACSKNATSLK